MPSYRFDVVYVDECGISHGQSSKNCCVTKEINGNYFGCSLPVVICFDTSASEYPPRCYCETHFNEMAESIAELKKGN